MSAHAAVELLSARIDGELDERDRAQVDRHLDSCPECRKRLDGLRAAAASLAALGPVASPRPLDRRRLRGIRLGERGSRFGVERDPAQRPDAGSLAWWPALALLALIGVGSGLLVPPEPAPPAVEQPLATTAALQGAPVAIVGDRIFRRDGAVWREVENGEATAPARPASPEQERSLREELPGLARLLADAPVEIVRGGSRLLLER